MNFDLAVDRGRGKEDSSRCSVIARVKNREESKIKCAEFTEEKITFESRPNFNSQHHTIVNESNVLLTNDFT